MYIETIIADVQESIEENGELLSATIRKTENPASAAFHFYADGKEFVLTIQSTDMQPADVPTADNS